MPDSEIEVAKAIACFEASNDLAFLRDVLRTIRPKAEAAALQAAQRGRDMPRPREVAGAPVAATPVQALATVRGTRDFALLQAMSRAAGRRAEELTRGQQQQ